MDSIQARLQWQGVGGVRTKDLIQVECGADDGVDSSDPSVDTKASNDGPYKGS